MSSDALTASSPSQSAHESVSSASSVSRASSLDDSLTCKWNACNEHFNTADELYDHLCERHVGRKSTNNLSLTCHWNQCRTTTVKRDHITSHIRVHVPLKPHKCEFCGKSFKRPQDLKKHVKTHAEDSSSLPRMPAPDPAGMNFRPQAPMKGLGTGVFYNHGAQMRNSANQMNFMGNMNNGYEGPPQASTNYGLYFNQPALAQPTQQHVQQVQQQQQQQQQQQHNSRADFNLTGGPTYSRKRGAELVDDFFEAAKRRQVDHMNYSQISRSLMPLHDMMAMPGSGLPSHLATQDYMVTTAPMAPNSVAVSNAPMAQTYYLPNMPHARTEKDLVQVGHILDQMASTVYEARIEPGIAMNHSPSPPGIERTASDAYAQINQQPQQMNSPLASISTGGTPVATPPSASLSYTSGQSPSPSAVEMSPHSRHNSTGGNANALYPTLPMVNGGMPGQTAVVTLNGMHDPGERRRYSSGLLQRANDRSRRSPSSESDSEADENYICWVNNMRVLEYMRDYVRHRLDNKDFEPEDEELTKTPNSPMTVDSPVIKMEIKTEPVDDDGPSLYPTLRM